MRVVLDTNILARAARGGTGLAAELLAEVADPAHVLVLSPFLVLELSRVLRYPRVRAMHGLDEADIDAYVQAVQSMGMIAIPVSASPTPVVTNDPTDDAVIATAVDGAAEVLCTLDRHFRTPAVLAYCTQHGVRVLSDIELLAEVRAQKP